MQDWQAARGLAQARRVPGCDAAQLKAAWTVLKTAQTAVPGVASSLSSEALPHWNVDDPCCMPARSVAGMVDPQ